MTPENPAAENPESSTEVVAATKPRQKKKPGPPKKRKSKARLEAEYAVKKAAAAERSRKIADAGKEIGPLPPIQNPDRRARCAESLEAFAYTYLPDRFNEPLSRDHLIAIERLERVVLTGGTFALAMPRGHGKTTWCKAASLWAVLCGYRSFVVIFGAKEALADQIADDIKSSLEQNDLLNEDFPEACHPIRCLGRVSHKARAQMLDGKPTRLVWQATEVRLATIDGSVSSGAIIRTAPIGGAVRGQNVKSQRPDLILLDDVQTRESAESPMQTDKLLKIIRADILRLGGKRSIACMSAWTVIAENDAASQLLDPEKNPQWLGVKTKHVDKWAVNRDLWSRYFEILDGSLKVGGGGAEAKQFYRDRRAAMDLEADLPWPTHFDDAKYTSAIEEAEVLRHNDPFGFAAESQNEPLVESTSTSTRTLDSAAIARRVNQVPRLIVPRSASRLVAFIDCGVSLLWYGVAAFDERFSGGLIDYGAWPSQNKRYFNKASAAPSLSDQYPKLTEGQRLYAALRDLVEHLLGRTYQRQEVGDRLTIERLLIDSGDNTDVVHEFIRTSPRAAVLLASKGWAQARSASPMSEWPIKDDERAGVGYRVRSGKTAKGRRVIFDADYFKAFVADRLETEPGAPGCFHLFGDNAEAHQMLGDHLAAEYAESVTLKGRTFHQWSPHPGSGDNDLLDVLTGLHVAAAVTGLKWSTGQSIGVGPRPPRAKKPKMSYQERFKKANPNPFPV